MTPSAPEDGDFYLIIPAYQAARHLRQLLPEIRRLQPHPIILVDDGSSDDIAAVAAGTERVTLIQHGRNRGKGAALKSGIAYICSLPKPPQAVLFMDADGQHAPAEIADLIHAFRQGNGTFIIGARQFKLNAMPFARILSNSITSWIVSRFIGSEVRDSQSGFRLVSHELLQQCLPLEADGYDMESELLLKAGHQGARFDHVPVKTIYGSEKSHIRGWRDTAAFVKTGWRFRNKGCLQDSE